ncbi:hypothetical protein ES703_125074 [subsurface metagenome]
MANKRRQPVSPNQLALIDIEPAPSKAKKPKRRKPDGRTENLERRVTQLEAEVTLVVEQLEREDDEEDLGR